MAVVAHREWATTPDAAAVCERNLRMDVGDTPMASAPPESTWQWIGSGQPSGIAVYSGHPVYLPKPATAFAETRCQNASAPRAVDREQESQVAAEGGL